MVLEVDYSLKSNIIGKVLIQEDILSVVSSAEMTTVVVWLCTWRVEKNPECVLHSSSRRVASRTRSGSTWFAESTRVCTSCAFGVAIFSLRYRQWHVRQLGIILRLSETGGINDKKKWKGRKAWPAKLVAKVGFADNSRSIKRVLNFPSRFSLKVDTSSKRRIIALLPVQWYIEWTAREKDKSFSQDPPSLSLDAWSRKEDTLYPYLPITITRLLYFTETCGTSGINDSKSHSQICAICVFVQALVFPPVYLFDPLFTLPRFFLLTPFSFCFLPSLTRFLSMVKRPILLVPVVPPTAAARDANSSSFLRLICLVIS